MDIVQNSNFHKIRKPDDAVHTTATTNSYDDIIKWPFFSNFLE